ncbi:hypothetical protein GCM10011289_02730 [Paludibacterium paludis]|uniref:LysB family phage lysis regulatory protein n=1 Tax=Paludibacterium paludis TaxID=1225769 RepID=A0A918U7A9_9NEIS|nr:hypothetical protein [Paludibacterium paludis]GGY03842.1 hypothetical protein GCM10011289_02730 [Paludibacterium paludis]
MNIDLRPLLLLLPAVVLGVVVWVKHAQVTRLEDKLTVANTIATHNDERIRLAAADIAQRDVQIAALTAENSKQAADFSAYIERLDAINRDTLNRAEALGRLLNESEPARAWGAVRLPDVVARLLEYHADTAGTASVADPLMSAGEALRPAAATSDIEPRTGLGTPDDPRRP